MPLMLGFSLFLRVIYVLFATDYANYVYSDMYVYDSTALRTIGQNNSVYHTYWAPGFSWFLSIEYKLLEGLGILEWRLPITLTLLALLGTIGIWFMYKVSQFILSERQAKWVLLLLSFWYPFIYLNTYLLSENLFIPLFFGGLYILLSTGKGLKLVLSGLIMGFAFLVRSLIAPVVLLQAGWLWWRSGSIIRVASFCLSVLGALVMGIAINIIISRGSISNLGEGGGFNFTLSWCDIKGVSDGNYTVYPPVNGRYLPPETFFHGEKSFSDQGYYYHKGLECLQQNPVKLLSNFRNVGNMFHSVLFPLDATVPFVEPVMALYKLANFLMLALTLVAIRFALKLKKESREKQIVILLATILVGVAIAVYLQNPGEERYLIPFEPILLILSIWGGAKLVAWWKRG